MQIVLLGYPYTPRAVDDIGCMRYISLMPDSPQKNTALNVRVVPEELIRKAKSSAAL